MTLARTSGSPIETLLKIEARTNAAKWRSEHATAANSRRRGSCVARRPT